MKFFTALVIATTAVCIVSIAANAGAIRRGDGPTLVWVKIKANPGETRWHACRRVYQRDVYQVRRGSGNTMWCNILSHRIYDYGERRQNFNLH